MRLYIIRNIVSQWISLWDVPRQYTSDQSIQEIIIALEEDDKKVLTRLEKIILGTYKSTRAEQRISQDAMQRAVSSDAWWDQHDYEPVDIADISMDPAVAHKKNEFYKIFEEYGFTKDDLEALSDPDNRMHQEVLEKIRSNDRLMELLAEYLG